MNPLLLAGTIVLVFIAAMIGWCVVLLRGKRTLFSPTANRAEKNAHHLASAILGVFCLAGAVVGLLMPAMNHPVLWLTVGLMVLFVLPTRAIMTELGIRRRVTRHPASQDH